jgi:hypothetical protein
LTLEPFHKGSLDVCIKKSNNWYNIYDLRLLNQVLSEKGLPTIEDAVTITITTNATTTTNTSLPDVVS